MNTDNRLIAIDTAAAIYNRICTLMGIEFGIEQRNECVSFVDAIIQAAQPEKPPTQQAELLSAIDTQAAQIAKMLEMFRSAAGAIGLANMLIDTLTADRDHWKRVATDKMNKLAHGRRAFNDSEAAVARLEQKVEEIIIERDKFNSQAISTVAKLQLRAEAAEKETETLRELVRWFVRCEFDNHPEFAGRISAAAIRKIWLEEYADQIIATVGTDWLESEGK